MRLVIQITTKINQSLLVTHPAPPKISPKFVDNFLSYPADRQIHKGRNITSLAEVMKTLMTRTTKMEICHHKIVFIFTYIIFRINVDIGAGA